MVLIVFLFIGGMLVTCPGFYFRNHYFLAAMPGLALLNAVAVTAVIDFLKRRDGRFTDILDTMVVERGHGASILKNGQRDDQNSE